MRAPEKIAGSAPGNSTRRKIARRRRQRAHHAHELAVGRAEPVHGVDDDREEAHDRDDDQLRRQSESEHDREDRCEQHGRHGLREHEDRQECASQRAEKWIRIARPSPTATASRYPRRTSRTVTQVALASRSSRARGTPRRRSAPGRGSRARRTRTTSSQTTTAPASRPSDGPNRFTRSPPAPFRAGRRTGRSRPRAAGGRAGDRRRARR